MGGRDHKPPIKPELPHGVLQRRSRKHPGIMDTAPNRKKPTDNSIPKHGATRPPIPPDSDLPPQEVTDSSSQPSNQIHRKIPVNDPSDPIGPEEPPHYIT